MGVAIPIAIPAKRRVEGEGETADRIFFKNKLANIACDVQKGGAKTATAGAPSGWAVGSDTKTGDIHPNQHEGTMNIPKDLRYTSTHEWVRIRNRIATVGITDFAQAQLSDLTFVELPAVDDELAASDEAAVVESVKAASDVYAPVSGRVIEINNRVIEQPDIINRDPYGEGWLFKIEMTDPSEVEDLMDADQYEETLPEEE